MKNFLFGIISSILLVTPSLSFDKSLYCYGDSIAVGFCNNSSGKRKVGASPSLVLFYLKTDISRLKEKNLILSTGISNNPYDFKSIENQFILLKENGVNVTVIGAAKGRYNIENKKLNDLCKKYGFLFKGPFTPGRDGVHPATYSTYR